MTSIVPQPSQSQSTVSHPSMTCSLSSNATTEHRPTVASRPKLTLQTTSLPKTFGTSSTGLSLSLAGGATASPTVRNTFKNAYDAALPASATASPSKSSNSRFSFSKPSSPYPSYAQNNNTNNNPYQLPLGVKSILRNSPLEPTCRLRSASVATSANGGTGSRRVFFPAKKQVNYRQPLEEEIKTVHYTARHSDLSGEPEAEQPPRTSSDQDSDSNSSLTSTSDEDDSAAGTRRSPLSSLERKKRKHLSAEKQVRAVALMDGLEENYGSTTPQTPRQKRVKRRCEWRWTLGPLEVNTESAKPPPAQDEMPSDPATTRTVPVLSNPVPKWVSKDVDSPASASDLLSASSAASLPYSSPSSSVASEVADKNDECWKTTSHEPERAHADPPE